MSLAAINWNPDRKMLRNFGLIALIATVGLAILLNLLKGVSMQWGAVIIAAGLVIFIISRLSLRLTKIIYLVLTIITMPIGIAVSFIVLALFYFVLLMPIGLFFRITGRDLLSLKFKKPADSYWTKCARSTTLERYFHQF